MRLGAMLLQTRPWHDLSSDTAACERRDRDPATPRRSLLLGFGTLRPAASVDSFLDAVGRASTAGFDEVVVYWPDGEPR